MGRTLQIVRSPCTGSKLLQILNSLQGHSQPNVEVNAQMYTHLTEYRHPQGYRLNPQCPVLRGGNHCKHCLCAPCVIIMPPDFLQGSCDPHPPNDEKRHRLYRLFRGLMSDIGYFRDHEYLRRKQTRTVCDDNREILPRCVIEVTCIYCC